MKLKYSPEMTIKILECLADGRSMGEVVIGEHPLPTALEVHDAKEALKNLQNLGFYKPSK